MKLSLHVGTDISLEGFSFSQLIIMTKELFDKEGLPGFVRVLMKVIEAKLLSEAEPKCKHCGSKSLYGHSSQERKIKTTVGYVILDLKRFRCQSCKRTFCPLNTLLDLNQYSRKSRELEKLSLETITNQSFRRSSNHLEDTLGIEVPHTTLHSWFTKTDSTIMNVQKRVQNIIADGTGFKKKKDEYGSNRGEVKVMVGLDSKGNVIPYGAWTRASWKNIGKFIKNQNHYSDKVKFRPIASTLITDGEEELIRHLKKLATSHQRCLFHMTYELKPLLQYRDIASKEHAIEFSKKLGDIIYIEIPEQDIDPIKNMEHKLKIELKYKEMKQKLDEFIKELKVMGYRKTMTFIENSKNQLFSYIDNWLKTGVSNPKVTSLVERMMREIKRRIKKIGFAWSERGAEQMTRLVLLQLSSTKEHWDVYWKNKMGFDSKIKLSFLGVTVEY